MLQLTDLDRCTKILFGQDGADVRHQELIGQLIDQVSARIHDDLDRELLEASRVEYYDGDGTNLLLLRQGPIASDADPPNLPLVSVAAIARTKDGGGAAVLTPTTIDAGDYIVEGLRVDGWTGCGALRRISGVWPCGRGNIRVTYTAGFVEDLDDTTNGPPLGLVAAATNHVCGEFQRRALIGLTQRTVGDASIASTIPDANWDAALDRAIAPYRRMRVG